MSLIATGKIADYIKLHPEARIPLLTLLKELPYSQSKNMFHFTELTPIRCGTGESMAGIGEFSIQYHINYAAKALFITWVGNAEERQQENQRRLEALRQKYPNETLVVQRVSISTRSSPVKKVNLAVQNKEHKNDAGSTISPIKVQQPERVVGSEQKSDAQAIFQSNEEYQTALARAFELKEYLPESAEFNELCALLPMIENYEYQQLTFPTLNLREIVEYKMNMLDWPQDYLYKIFGGQDKLDSFFAGKDPSPSVMKKLFKKLWLQFPITDQRFYHQPQ